MLKLHENPIREFEKEDVINQSEHGGMLYWLDDKQKEYVKEFETKHNAVVYHVIHNYTDMGEMLAFLYVSAEEEEWEYDHDDLKYGCVCAYVMNLDDEWCSEFGSIGIRPQFGGLVRTDIR
ncbi:MAG: hypothetical protein PHW00_06280 [Clostridia bacterium]|nr:hypothetical protein [Clostridia bacterium]